MSSSVEYFNPGSRRGKNWKRIGPDFERRNREKVYKKYGYMPHPPEGWSFFPGYSVRTKVSEFPIYRALYPLGAARPSTVSRPNVWPGFAETNISRQNWDPSTPRAARPADSYRGEYYPLYSNPVWRFSPTSHNFRFNRSRKRVSRKRVSRKRVSRRRRNP